MGGAAESIVLSARCRDFIKEAAKLELQSGVELETKFMLWDKILDEFLIAGVPKHEISGLVRRELKKQLIEEYKEQKIELDEKNIEINSGHYYRWARSREITDPDFNPKKNQEGLPQGNYKDSSLFTPEVSDEKPFAILRNQYIMIAQELRQQLKQNIDLMKIEFAPDVWEEFFKDKSEVGKFFRLLQDMLVADIPENNRCRDTRHALLPVQRFLAVSIKCFVGNKWFCKNYYSVVKQKTKITPKKFSLFLDDVNSISDLIYYVQDNPLNLHFLDIRCPKCKRYSLKTTWHENGTWDIFCINESAHNDRKIRFPASIIFERLEQLKRNKVAAAYFLKNYDIIIPSNEPILSTLSTHRDHSTN